MPTSSVRGSRPATSTWNRVRDGSGDRPVRHPSHLGTVVFVKEKVSTENRWLRARRRIASNPVLNLSYRIAVGVIGTAVLVVGIVTIPYPGPGWLIVFAGLGILGSEFAWA